MPTGPDLNTTKMAPRIVPWEQYCSFPTVRASRVTLDLVDELPAHFVTHLVGRTNALAETQRNGLWPVARGPLAQTMHTCDGPR